MIKISAKNRKRAADYQKKWWNIAVSTQPIIQADAYKAVQNIYEFLKLEHCEVLFVKSPYQALQIIKEDNINSLKNFIKLDLIGIELVFDLASQTGEDLGKEIFEIFQEFEEVDKFDITIEEALRIFFDTKNRVNLNYNKFISKCLKPEARCETFCIIDFCTSILNYSVDLERWNSFQELIKSCGWIFPFENVCLVCDRPITLSFDNEGRLHAEKKPAIEFSDGFSIYIDRGKIIRDIFPSF
jgi:hypothetical protein